MSDVNQCRREGGALIRITHDADGYPIVAMKLVEIGRFRSMSEAARALGMAPDSVRVAVNEGRSAKGIFFRYADMPAECQPLRRRRQTGIPVIWEGKEYPSIYEAAGRRKGAPYMRIFRAMKRGRNQ